MRIQSWMENVWLLFKPIQQPWLKFWRPSSLPLKARLKDAFNRTPAVPHSICCLISQLLRSSTVWPQHLPKQDAFGEQHLFFPKSLFFLLSSLILSLSFLETRYSGPKQHCKGSRARFVWNRHQVPSGALTGCYRLQTLCSKRKRKFCTSNSNPASKAKC